MGYECTVGGNGWVSVYFLKIFDKFSENYQEFFRKFQIYENGGLWYVGVVCVGYGIWDMGVGCGGVGSKWKFSINFRKI